MELREEKRGWACDRKFHYPNKQKAKKSLKRLRSSQSNRGHETEVYRCECGGWLLGRPSEGILKRRNRAKKITGTTKPEGWRAV